jgi:hypothetical protein
VYKQKSKLREDFQQGAIIPRMPIINKEVQEYTPLKQFDEGFQVPEGADKGMQEFEELTHQVAMKEKQNNSRVSSQH